MDGCVEQHFCATVLYLLSMLAHTYNLIIDRGGGETGNEIDVVDGLNDTDKQLLLNVHGSCATAWRSSL